ncbi:MAG: hypothetical protein Q9212_003442 [Teloschistes hypoglaucus]
MSVQCDVTEFKLRNGSSLTEDQFVYNPDKKANLNEYLEEALGSSFRGFPKKWFREDDDFHVKRDFLLSIFDYHNKLPVGKARNLIHDTLKLVVLTYMMTHHLSLDQESKRDVYGRLAIQSIAKLHPGFSCPKLVNKQIKFLLSGLYKHLSMMIMLRIQELLIHWEKKQFWGALFASTVILTLIIEELEFTARLRETREKKEGVFQKDDRTADYAIALMDENINFLQGLFNLKYRTLSPEGLNPLLSSQNRASLDHESQALAASADEIVRDHRLFLEAREVLEPPSTYREHRTSSLLARFLLGFYPKETLH